MKTLLGCHCLLSYGSIDKYTFCRNRFGTTYIRERITPKRPITLKRIIADIRFKNAVQLYNSHIKYNKEYLQSLKIISKKLNYCNAYFCFVGNIIEYQKYYTISEIENMILNNTIIYKKTSNKIKIDDRNKKLTYTCLSKINKTKIDLKSIYHIYSFLNVKDNTGAFLDLKISTPPDIIDKLKNIGALI